MDSGALCAMTFGELLMHKWLADNLGSLLLVCKTNSSMSMQICSICYWYVHSSL